MARPSHLSYWYLILPTVTSVLILPPVLQLPPFLPAGLENPNAFQFLMAFPFYVGLVSAPGYIYAWLGHYDPQTLGRKTRLWVHASLVGAAVASLVGGLLSIFTVIVAPFALGSLVASIKLVIQFQRGGKTVT